MRGSFVRRRRGSAGLRSRLIEAPTTGGHHCTQSAGPPVPCAEWTRRVWDGSLHAVGNKPSHTYRACRRPERPGHRSRTRRYISWRECHWRMNPDAVDAVDKFGHAPPHASGPGVSFRARSMERRRRGRIRREPTGKQRWERQSVHVKSRRRAETRPCTEKGRTVSGRPKSKKEKKAESRTLQKTDDALMADWFTCSMQTVIDLVSFFAAEQSRAAATSPTAIGAHRSRHRV
jgi:hypothetical protein